MIDFILRDYELSDLTDLIDLYRATIRISARGHYSADQIRAWAPDEIDIDGVRNRFAEQEVRIAEVGGRLAGFATMTADGYVDMLFVHPDFQRGGIARALLEDLEAMAHRHGISRMTAEASHMARPAFEAMGFQLLASQEVELRGEVLINFRMEKRLGED